ncbi:hypothetical protein PP178_12950 [Zeaxanthinibacter sp. PT1]|uniref:hypothetical protein n=1 Tax=Zeaxanthinibacter TaxID=561554 RepID=UPI0023493FB8|nr:hypothetical protein [Zeaxanthinibacter sp. PT1]MDC6352461.1 hypothetical protein [Zeaxanthinibacter sp. PT1]
MLARFFFWCMMVMMTVSVRAQEADCPCCSVVYQAFDFWIGEWEVYNRDGSIAGTNIITKVEDGCGLREEWKSANGTFTGTSLNFYDKKNGQWKQLWVDNAGNHLDLRGNPVQNGMVLSSEPFRGQDGKMYVNRISWTANPEGTVRQLWEVLQGEEVASVIFDGLYTPKEKIEGN